MCIYAFNSSFYNWVFIFGDCNWDYVFKIKSNWSEILLTLSVKLD